MPEPASQTSLAESVKASLAVVGDNPILQAGVLLVLVVAFAKLVEWLIARVIKRLTAKTATRIDDLIVRHVRSPLFWSMILLGTMLAATVADIPEKYRVIFNSAAISLMAVLWTVFLLRVSKLLLSIAAQHGKEPALVRAQTLPLFTNLAAMVIVVGGVYVVFQAWNIDMTAWLASAGILGIAIGFAAKDTLANLFSGVFILADSPYKIGDYVLLDDGTGIRGKVTHIGIRSTRLLTRDDVEVTIPNSIMGNSKVINESGGPHLKYRIRVKIGVAYGSDIDQVREVLTRVAKAEPSVCEEPEPRVRMRAFGASSLDFELLCWVDEPELRGRVLDKLNTTIYKAFIAEAIEIPYSKHDLYIKELPGAKEES